MPLKIYHIFKREREKEYGLFRLNFSFAEESPDQADQDRDSRYYGGSDYAGYCCSRSRLAAGESVSAAELSTPKFSSSSPMLLE